MQRDMSLLRTICLTIEAGQPIELDDRTAYHVELLLAMGLIRGDVWEAGARRFVSEPHLTPAGHDFTDLARDDALWRAVATRVEATVGTTAFEVWLTLLHHDHAERLE